MRKQPRKMLAPGTLLAARYEVVKFIGSGAVGTVLHVLDRELEGQSLAIKVLHPHLAEDPAVVKRFCAEAILSRQLSHPNIVRVYDVTSTESLHFITMEFVKGCSLEELLEGNVGRALPLAEAIHIWKQILAGLISAHESEVLHRDIKPSNILIDGAGNVKILDFGLAKSIEGSDGLTRTGELVGSPIYMAPEQFSNTATVSSDLYSFSILAFESLAGAPPFQSDNALALMQMHQREEFPWSDLEEKGAPLWLVELLRSCAAKMPTERPKSAREIVSILNSHQHTEVPEQVCSNICKGVRRRARSHHILNKEFRRFVCVVWAICVFVGFGATLNEKSARQRIATRAVNLQSVTGINVDWILWTLGFGLYIDLDSQALFLAIKSHDVFATRLLLDVGVNPNSVNEDGVSALMMLANTSWETIPYICEHGAFVDAVSPSGETALISAVKYGNRERILALMNGCRPSMRVADNDGNTPLTVAVSLGDTAFLDWAMQIMPGEALKAQRILNSNGMNAMHIAVQKQDAEMVDKLLDHGFDVDMRDGEGNTPLMRLLKSPRNASTEEIFVSLLRASANLNARDDKGNNVSAIVEKGTGKEWRELVKQSFSMKNP